MVNIHSSFIEGIALVDEMVAIKNFKGTETFHQLSVEAGNQLLVFKFCFANGWLWARNKLGQQGFVPALYLRRLNQHNPAQSDREQLRQCVPQHTNRSLNQTQRDQVDQREQLQPQHVHQRTKGSYSNTQHEAGHHRAETVQVLQEKQLIQPTSSDSHGDNKVTFSDFPSHAVENVRPTTGLREQRPVVGVNQISRLTSQSDTLAETRKLVDRLCRIYQTADETAPRHQPVVETRDKYRKVEEQHSTSESDDVKDVQRLVNHLKDKFAIVAQRSS